METERHDHCDARYGFFRDGVRTIDGLIILIFSIVNRCNGFVTVGSRTTIWVIIIVNIIL